MNTEYQFFTKEIANLDFNSTGNAGTHWEAFRTHKMPNGDTWHYRLRFCDTKEEAQAVIEKWTKK